MKKLEMALFMLEMKKITEQFGTKAYSDHKINLIYKEFMWFSQQLLTQVIDDLIGHARFAPTLTDFMDSKAKFREEEHAKLKAKRAKETPRLSPDEFSKGFAAISKMMTQQDFDKFPKMAKYVTNISTSTCKICGDDGLCNAEKDKYSYVFRCNCLSGKERREAFPLWGQDHKKKGFSLLIDGKIAKEHYPELDSLC